MVQLKRLEKKQFEDQTLGGERGQGKKKKLPPCSADYAQDWQPYRVDLYSAESVDYTYILNLLQDGYKKRPEKKT